MKQLLTAFFIVLLIGACSTNTEPAPPPFTPQTFGQWHVDAINHASLEIGDNTAAYMTADSTFQVGDTVLVDNPVDYEMEVEVDSARGYLRTSFRDYTLSLGDIAIVNTISSANGRVQLQHIGQGIGNSIGYKVNFKITYHPAAPQTQEYVYLSTYTFDNERYKTYKIYVAGLDSTVAYMSQYL